MPPWVDSWEERAGGWGRDDGIIWAFDFTQPSLLTTSPETIAAAKAYLTDKGAGFARASAATVQTSASSVYTAFGVDDPRIGNAGSGQGLVIEEARTNLVQVSRELAGAGWNAGTGTTTLAYAAGPDDSAGSADRAVCASDQYSPYWGGTLAAGKHTASQWVRHATGSGQHGWNVAGASGSAGETFAIDATWRRRTLTADVAEGAGAYVPVEGRTINGVTAGARDTVVDFHQVEVGAFATEAIITDGATVTRAADVFAVDFAHSVIAGRKRQSIRFRPKGATGDYSSAGMYVFSNAATTSRAYFMNTGAIVVEVAGVALVSTNTITWAAHDWVDLYIEAGLGAPYVALRKNGAARALFTFEGAHADAVPNTGTDYILNANGSNPLTAWLAKLIGHKTRPAWAV